MKILVAIANYGTGNDGYLAQVLGEFRRMRHDVDIVVNTNIKKELGPDVEVVVGFPAKDPKSLPFAHKQIFVDRLEQYDLFIYTEDDTLITEQNIDAFLRVTEVLPEDEIAGFLRTEQKPDGAVYFPEVHQHYHWDVESISSRGPYKFAFYTDEHSGSYILTRKQLRRAIASGGFLVPFYEEKYPPLETAATDPYTNCGFRKMMCISHFEEFVLPHLSNKYAGNGITIAGEEFYRQLDALLGISKNGKPIRPLLSAETKLYHSHWSKFYYEPVQHSLVSLVPSEARTILSVGCGWGVTEKWLMDKSLQVTAIPIDSVIAACAEARGVEIVQGDLPTAVEKLANRRFDCVLISNVLHLVRDPVEFLSPLAQLLSANGRLAASVPNVSWSRRLARTIRLRGHRANPQSYERSGMHVSTGRRLKRWFQGAGLRPAQIVYEVLDEKKRADMLTQGLAKPLLASNVYLAGGRD
jgi:2-polyprenyl-3-methyl-5-hydroxy-6-metoxy-1,4-benzoquinol methylase